MRCQDLELERRDVKRKDPQEKGIKQNWGETKDISTERDLKKWEMSRFKAFKRKTCQEKGASRKTHVKNKGKEKELSRESGVKKRRPQERELWRETSAKAAKRCQSEEAPREWDFKIRSQEKRHIKQGQAKMSREKWTAKRCKFRRGSQAFVGSHPAMAERFCKEMIECLQTGCTVCFHQIKMLDRWCEFIVFLLYFTQIREVKAIAVHHVAPDPIRAPNRVESAQPRGGPNSGAGWPLLGCATPPPHLSIRRYDYETLRNMAIGWDNSPGFSFFLIVKLLSNYCQTPV